jgi:hypothetical protein
VITMERPRGEGVSNAGATFARRLPIVAVGDRSGCCGGALPALQPIARITRTGGPRHGRNTHERASSSSGERRNLRRHITRERLPAAACAKLGPTQSGECPSRADSPTGWTGEARLGDA